MCKEEKAEAKKKFGDLASTTGVDPVVIAQMENGGRASGIRPDQERAVRAGLAAMRQQNGGMRATMK